MTKLNNNHQGRVAGKVALVTGAASGLGFATAQALAREGAWVALTDIDHVGVETAARTIGDAAMPFVHDVTKQDDWITVLAAVEDTMGGLNILVNNAGIVIMGSVEELSFEDWKKLHAVDLDSVFLGCKHAIPLIANSGGGSIINISSISGIIAGHNLVAYNSAKAAVRHLTKSVALHCARAGNNIRCNSVHPTFVDTPILDDVVLGGDRAAALAKLARQIPLQRLGTADDIANAVLYLASDDSSFMTAAELVLDGGMSAM